jgi:hypothetical protein
MNRPVRLLISNLPLAKYWRTAALYVFSPESVAPNRPRSQSVDADNRSGFFDPKGQQTSSSRIGQVLMSNTCPEGQISDAQIGNP